MFENIKKYIVDRRISRFIQKRKNKAFVPLSASSRVLLLYEVHSCTENLLYESFINDLKQKGKEVKAIAFCKTFEDDQKPQGQALFFSIDELSALKLPPETVMHEATTFGEDLLIDLTLHTSVGLKYIAARSKANLKVGRQIEDRNWLDMQIALHEDDDVKSLYELIVHYLECIRKK